MLASRKDDIRHQDFFVFTIHIIMHYMILKCLSVYEAINFTVEANPYLEIKLKQVTHSNNIITLTGVQQPVTWATTIILPPIPTVGDSSYLRKRSHWLEF